MKSRRLRAVAFSAVFWTVLLSAEPRLKYVVIVNRHGVRSPTWDASRLNQYSAKPWPDWGVRPGDLTPHGRKLIGILGSYYRDWLAGEHLLSGNGCGDTNRIYIWADTDQRTLETGRAFAESIVPGCGLAIHSRPEDQKDPVFSGLGAPDLKSAAEAVRGRLGSDPRKLLEDHRGALDILQFILTGGKGTPKKLLESPAEIAVIAEGKAIELQGPFAPSSTLSENLLLEYADGMQGEKLAWGRLTRESLFSVLELHHVYADLMRRTRYPARTRGSNLLAHVLASMEQAATGKPVPGGIGAPDTSLLILSGHDTNLSNLAGMLDLSWTLPGYQPDETPPGGALIFSLWRDSASGQMSVRAQYLAATLDQMRNADPLTLDAPPPSQPVSIPGCTPQCSWPEFKLTVSRKLDPSRIDFSTH